MSATETIQLRIEPSIKQDYERRCRANGQTVSQAVRDLIVADLYADQTPLARLDAIFASAAERREAAGLPEPSVEEVVAFCDRVKQERASQMLSVVSA